MKIGFPFDGESAASLFSANEKGTGGFYPVGANNFWHGGIHLPLDKSVVAMADGTLMAYRTNQELLKCKIDNKELKFSNGFVLLRHELNSPDGFSLTFYSLYMHLLPLSKYSAAQKKNAPSFFPRKYKTKVDLRVHESGSLSSPSPRTLAKDTVVNFKDSESINKGWQELADGGYIYFSDTYVSTSIEAPEYDKVVNVSPLVPIKQGDLLGYPGPYMETEKVLHVEVFTDSATFLENPRGIKRGPKTLKIPLGTSFKAVEPDIEKIVVNLTPGSRLKLVEEDKSSDKRKVSCVDIVGWVKRNVLGAYDQNRNAYPLVQDVSSMYARAPSSLRDTPPQISISAKTGETVRYLEKSGDFRRIGISIKEKKEGWAVKKDLGKYSSGEYTLANPLNELLTQNPRIAFKFEKVAGQNTKELLIEESRARAGAMKNHRNETWYELEYEAGKKGWIKSDDPKITILSDYDWPGWHKIQESGKYSKDGFCDITELINVIDKEEKPGPQANAPKVKDAKLTHAEIKAAVHDARIGPILRRLVCLHPTEWDAKTDHSIDKWKRLKEKPWNMSEESYQDTLNYIKALQWWSDVDKRNIPADSTQVWHVHPVAFIGHVKQLAVPLLLEDKRKIVDVIAGFESLGSTYAAVNRDYEFEGYFDEPDDWYKDKTKAKPDAIGVTASKYSEHPRHVGLSFGLIQFTQESSLGELVKKMNEKDPVKFKEVFGEHWEDLLNTLQKTGNSTSVEEEMYDNTGTSLGKKHVGRAPGVQPVAGHEVWDDYWVEKFQASANHVPFQESQEDLAVSAYMDVFLQKAKGRTLSEKSITFLYNISVNQGQSHASSLVRKVLEAADEKEYWRNFVENKIASWPKFRKERMKTIQNSDKVSWDIVYDIE